MMTGPATMLGCKPITDMKLITDCILVASSFVDRDMYMRFLGIGIGHCNQHPSEADLGSGDGSDFQTLFVDDGDEGDGNMAAGEAKDIQDDEDEGTDLEGYGEGDSDEFSDDDFRYDSL